MSNLISKFTKFIQSKNSRLFPLLLIILLSFFVWRHIPSLQFEGEGYYYFPRVIEYKNVFELLHDTTTPLKYDAFATFIFSIIVPHFRDQVYLYMWFQLIFMLVIDVVFYFTARLLIGNKLAGFLAALIFSTSFIGKFDMYSNGGYQYFLQRATPLLPHLLALFFLCRYLKNLKLFYYVTSVFLYLLGIVMGFFATFFLPVFVFIPLAYINFKARKFWNHFLRIFWTPLPFIIGNFLIIRNDNYAFPEDSIIELLTNRTSFIFNGLMQQLAVMTLPLDWYASLTQFAAAANKLFYLKTTYAYIPISQMDPLFVNIIVISIYSAATILIWKLSPRFFSLAIGSMLATMGILFFNLYLNSHESLSTNSSTRYFYYPSVTLAFYWGIFWSSLFLQKKLRFKLALAVFCIIWVIHNILSIDKGLKANEWRNKTNKDVISYLRSWSPQLKEEPSYVYLPRTLGRYGEAFVFKYFSHPDGIFVLEGFGEINLEELASKNFSSEKLYVLEINERTNELVDSSIEYRTQLEKLKRR